MLKGDQRTALRNACKLELRSDKLTGGERRMLQALDARKLKPANDHPRPTWAQLSSAKSHPNCTRNTWVAQLSRKGEVGAFFCPLGQHAMPVSFSRSAQILPVPVSQQSTEREGMKILMSLQRLQELCCILLRKSCKLPRLAYLERLEIATGQPFANFLNP